MHVAPFLHGYDAHSSTLMSHRSPAQPRLQEHVH